ncbi:OsmC family protein [Geobacter argillaceus]|uniref:Putative OsmC-like protein n=1 Tax=Geobacter argillaceus TaxID=345631 RepID=A0A562VPD2_9BACT|nr:OsmC family protein [Geobacter argillaceus]TWJ19740.1 putative OsmC-like protein [Geobacter argillaceus]
MSDSIKLSVENLIEAVKNNPKLANSVFRASTYSDNPGFTVRSEVRGFTIPIDEPRDLGGSDTAPNPVELLLAALGGCQEIVYRAFAAVLGIDIQSIQVHAKGNIDLHGFLGLAEVPAGFSSISFTTCVVSSASPESISQLATLVEKHCPVQDTLTRSIPVSGKVELMQPGDPAGDVTVITSAR